MEMTNVSEIQRILEEFPNLKPENENGFRQLTWIKYKINTDKVLQIKPKEELKRRTGKSPDFAEAFMLTFAPPIPQLDIFFI